MANVSTARKLGIAARIAGQQVKQSRTYAAVLSGARATLGHLAGVLRQLPVWQAGYMHADRFDITNKKLAKGVGSIHERVATIPHGNAAPEERSMRLSPHCARAQH